MCVCVIVTGATMLRNCVWSFWQRTIQFQSSIIPKSHCIFEKRYKMHVSDVYIRSCSRYHKCLFWYEMKIRFEFRNESLSYKFIENCLHHSIDLLCLRLLFSFSFTIVRLNKLLYSNILLFITKFVWLLIQKD